MKVQNKAFFVISLLMALSMLLAACAPQTVTVEKTVEVEKVVTEEVVKEVVVTQEVVKEVVVEVTPTPVPVDRNGAWVDMVVVVEEPSSEAAVTRLGTGELDVFAYTVSNPDIFQNVKDNPDLAYSQSVGSYNELTFNPGGPVLANTGKLNPFGVPAIREAMNMLIDRNYITQEIMGGLGRPRWLAINTTFADYARYIDTARKLEAEYAYNPEKANEIITAEMEALGATLVDGKWNYNGEPVELIALIRTEDERRDIGDYVSNQLESIGFTVVRDYKTSAEASPIWQRGNPEDGLFSFYTGGWISTAISRDDATNFDFFYTPRGLPRPLWQAYKPSPEFDEVSSKLNNSEFASMEERDTLFAQALELSMKDSVRVWLADRLSFTPRRADVSVTSDLAGAVAGSRLWPFTLKREGEVGGAMTVAMPSILTEAWNPVAGSNWIYDMALIRAVGDVGVMPDPHTGLTWPQRVESVAVTAKEGLPITKTLDWLTLDFAPSVEVPTDAFVDWDPVNQAFLTAGDVYTETQTANLKIVTTYPGDLYDIKWHDGSNFDLADVIMRLIIRYDLGNPDSPYYDEAQAPALEAFKSFFKGFRITSEDPLVIETYVDQYALDAENSLWTHWPAYDQGDASWDMIALGLKAEETGELAFSADKATANEIEQMSYISGPSIEILKAKLDEAAAEGYIPYANTLGQYITADEAAARWANYAEWYRTKGHFWLGTGPFYFEKAFPVEGTAILKANDFYPDSVEKWARYGDPKIADVEVDGPGQVKAGDEATFDVFVTFKGEVYPQSDITTVKYLLFDATGQLVGTGEATAVADGQYQVVLPADVTSKLEAGSNKLEVVVVPAVVSIPSIADYEFVSVP